MFPLRFLLGAALGASAVLLLSPSVARRARPAAKAALKQALRTLHAAEVSSAEFAESVEDLYAEAKDEVIREMIAEAVAEAQEKAAAKAASAVPEEDAPRPAAARKKARSTATRKKRSKGRSGNGSGAGSAADG